MTDLPSVPASFLLSLGESVPKPISGSREKESTSRGSVRVIIGAGYDHLQTRTHQQFHVAAT